ncbi:glycosyltransferase family 2 protein [Burkholderia sp. 22PA0106]|uniref:glycosyltransferase family 2 protein n=1 Tax=Burkholderia sp. 22PA0106 TaxID=3237371 RepID=UPI0039C409B9
MANSPIAAVTPPHVRDARLATSLAKRNDEAGRAPAPESAVIRLYGTRQAAPSDTRPSPHKHVLARRALSILIVAHNAADRIDAQLEMLAMAARYRDWQVIVIDNASTDGTAERIETRFDWVRLIRSPVNLGYAAACNLAAQEALGALLLFLHPGAHAQPAMIARAAARMLVNPQVGIAGGRLVDRQGYDVPTSHRFPTTLGDAFAWRGPAAHGEQPRHPALDPDLLPRPPARRVDWVSDAFAIVRHDVFRYLDGFDTRFFMYCEDIDFCRRVGEAGFEVMVWPDVRARFVARTHADAWFEPQAAAQRERWRLRSRLLYLGKHRGTTSAWLANRVESAWLTLAGWGYRCGGGLSSSGQGHRHALARRAQVEDAWRATDGGRNAPPGPWQ